MERVWKTAEPIGDEARAAFPEIAPTVLQLLRNRGLVSQAAIDEFLDPDYGKDLHDPYLFRDMDKAVTRLLAAIRGKERIAVHGDYDADGVCGATVMVSTLRAMGGEVEIFLPHRELDGYGLNMRTVGGFAERGVKVIVTCDCGIANRAEIAAAAERGMDTIVTDHHAMPDELPDAYATIHPKVPGETYPFDGLAGGGVAWKLASALISRAGEVGAELPPGFEKWLLDLVAISTVADMVPLLGESRTLVKFGLIVLAKTRRPGLRALMRSAGVYAADGSPKRAIDATTIGFQIAPRLNAAGRLDHANAAFGLLMETDPARADRLAEALGETNAARQRLTEACVSEARAQIRENGWGGDPAIVVSGDWPPGILGLVAGKLMDEFYRPVFAVSERENCVGSGRSIPEYHVVEAMRAIGDVFERFGGHPQACGFTVKSGMIGELRERLKRHAAEVFGEDELKPTLAIDSEIALEAADWAFLDGVKRFEPYGVGNPEPRFLARGLRVADVATVGADRKHLRLTVTHHSGESRKMIAFGMGAKAETVFPGSSIDAVFSVGENEWNGNRELQLKVIDLRLTNSGH